LAKLRTEEGKLQGITLFVGWGSTLRKKEIPGFWFWRGKESEASWAEVFRDLVNRGERGDRADEARVGKVFSRRSRPWK